MANQFGTVVKKRPTTRVVVVLWLTATYMVAQAVGGFMSNSLALVADAGHMLADVAALSMSLIAFRLASRPASDTASYGYYRAEVIAALLNGLVLLILSFFIVKEAIVRLLHPSQVEAKLMLVVAVGGLLINIVGLLLLHRDKSSNLNMRGAWLHVLADALGSVGVIISGLLIYFFQWPLVDSIASLAIAIMVAYSAIRLVLDTVHVLMEHTPSHIKPHKVYQEILALQNVQKAHDLHVWTISSGIDALSVHVVAKKGVDYDQLLNQIQQTLEAKFGIHHATIQVESECQVKDKTC